MCGPQEIIERRLVCDGCPALKTERWDYYDENDYHESGTGADCMKANKRITAYWHEKHSAPEWCPVMPANAELRGGLAVSSPERPA